MFKVKIRATPSLLAIGWAELARKLAECLDHFQAEGAEGHSPGSGPVERHVQRDSRMGQRDADPVDPGFSDRGLSPGPRRRRLRAAPRSAGVALSHRLAKLIARHVVQKDDVGPDGQNGGKLLERVDLDFHNRSRGRLGRLAAAKVPPRPLDRFRG